MELEIENNNGINPNNMTGTERFQVRMSEEHKDVVSAEKRDTKNGKGTFTQYTLYLTDDKGEERELRFLFGKHFNQLIKAWGKDSTQWAGKDVLVIPIQAGEFKDVKLEPAGKRLQEHITEVTEENIAV